MKGNIQFFATNPTRIPPHRGVNVGKAIGKHWKHVRAQGKTQEKHKESIVILCTTALGSIGKP
jgi:hypothetical protein